MSEKKSQRPLPMPPRTVERRGGYLSLIGPWVLRVFLLPHTIVAFVAPFVVLASLIWALFGDSIHATIVGGSRGTSGKHGSSPSVRYRYLDDAKSEERSTTVEASRLGYYLDANLRPVAEHAAVHAHYLRIGPFSHACLIEEESVWSTVGGALVFTLVWDGLMSVFIYIAWIQPMRQKWLYRAGVEVAGKITALDKVRGKSTRYVANYTYQVGAGDPLTGRMDSTLALWNTASVGQVVRVLYDPNHPQRSVVYELGSYKVQSNTIWDY